MTPDDDQPPAAPSAAPTGARLWLEAARPRTLPASIVPVVVGTAASDSVLLGLGGLDRVAEAFGVDASLLAASGAPSPDWLAFALALVVSLALQVAVNYANDWFDGIRGVDTPTRVGPRRVTAEGLVTPSQIRLATLLALLVAGIAGLALAALVDWRLLLVGVAAGVAALGYSGGPRPYASAGLGEVMVFVFFGLVATLGSQYVQDERVSSVGVVCAIAVGLWSVALLLVNNLRDIPTDREVGKRTLAVRIGEEWTRAAYVACLMVAMALALALVPMTSEGWLALPLLSLPLVAPAVAVVWKAPIGPRMVAALGATARGQLAFGALLAVGLLLRDPELVRVADRLS